MVHEGECGGTPAPRRAPQPHGRREAGAAGVAKPGRCGCRGRRL